MPSVDQNQVPPQPKLKKSQRSTFLLGENLKQAAKDARRSQELTKKDYKKEIKGKTGKLKLETKQSLFWTMERKDNNNNRNNTNRKPYHSTGKKYHN